jgi:hypothetical protein
VDRDIEAYSKELDTNDAAEAECSPRSDDGGGDRGDGSGGDGDLAQKVVALMAKRAQAQADLDRLDMSGETQLSRTDADARLLAKSGQTVAGYNVQIAVDDKHKLIVASEVVNDGNDAGQLHEMAKAAKQALGVETLKALADTGYYNGPALKACEDDGITAYVPEPDRTARLAAQGRFSHEDFTYDAAADAYRCPAGELLRPIEGRQRSGDRLLIRYMSRKSVVRRVPLARALHHRGDAEALHLSLGARGRARAASRAHAGGRSADAPPLRPGGASLRDAQVPRRLPPLPGARLRQGARRVEPDGALLQPRPRAQHRRPRPPCCPPRRALA